MPAFPIIARIVWEPAIEPPLIVVLALLLSGMAVRVYFRAAPRLAKWRRVLLLSLRLAVIALLCALLFQPLREEELPRVLPHRSALVAIDTSKSMNEPDAPGKTTRLLAAIALAQEHGLAPGRTDVGEVRCFSFDESAKPAPQSLILLKAEGETTHFHTPLTEVLSHARRGEHCAGLFLFSDGHDFQLEPASRTAQQARAQRIPIWAIPMGKVQIIPDLSVAMTSGAPSTFVKQRVRLQAALRATACGPQPVRVELLRQGKVLRSQQVRPGNEPEVPVTFEVSEDEPGQYEYEIRASVLPGERESGNNAAFTYLNVTAARIPVLLIEGQPHWDSTFLQRTLVRNERVRLDSIVRLGRGVPLLTRHAADGGLLTMPKTAADFRQWPVIIMGRGVDEVLDAAALTALGEAVSEGGASVVMVRGSPGRSPVLDEMAPADWTGEKAGPVRMQIRSGGAIAPVDVLAATPGGADALPVLPAAHATAKPKPLTAVEATAEDAQSQNAQPAILHRRFGNGQVLAVALDGTWKWALHAKSDRSANVYDRFWNQLLLNLLARSVAAAGDRTQLSVVNANLRPGEKVHFTLHTPQAKRSGAAVTPQVAVFRGNERVADVPMTQEKPELPWQGSLIAGKAGRYRAEAAIHGETVSCLYGVFEERREMTDTSLDLNYLRKLSESSGGRVIDPAELPDTIAALRRTAAAEDAAPPQVRRTTLWDRWLVFALLCSLWSVEWFLRRRWGLA